MFAFVVFVFIFQY